MSSVQLLFQQAMQLQAVGKLQQAQACFQHLLQQQPANPDFQHLYAILLYRLGNFEQSLKHAKMALEIAPNTAEYLNSLGVIARASGEYGIAESSFLSAIDYKTGLVDAYVNLGNLYLSQQRWIEAKAILQRGIQQVPSELKLQSALASAHLGMQEYEQAIGLYSGVVESDKSSAIANYNLALALKEKGTIKQAQEVVARALSLQPGYTNALLLDGELQEIQGNIDQAIQSYVRCINAEPQKAAAYWALANLGRYQFEPELIAAMENQWQKQMSDEDKCYFSFALAKAYEQTGEYAKSFDKLLIANRLKRKQVSYSTVETQELLALQRSSFTKEYLEQLARAHKSEQSPIFIVGMPRSGTSLIEQILAAHKHVVTGGELTTSLEIQDRLPEWQNSKLQDVLPKLTTETLSLAHNYYLQQNQELVQQGKVFTDKLPFNFAMLGMLKAIFPKAKFVHVYKHPLDACLGCFKQLFTQSQTFSYDLQEIADFYLGYREIMQHWNELLADSIVQVSYDKLVTEPNVQISKMLQGLDLEWQDRCLNFYQHKGIVKTASSGQVREKINTKAVGRWRNYQLELQPIKDKLLAAGIKL